MPRNIVIFADGTGQRGGVMVDETRSNVYKLYRATRGGTETSIDPATQLAFYDAGIGTVPPDAGFLGALGNRIYNFVSQALGLGLTRNIVDCYAAILQLWRPGDRIFLFGFSRGAYTVRCLAATICKCGIPTQMKDGKPLKYDARSARRIANEAVRKVYQHTSSWDQARATARQKELLAQREALAARFRKQYASAGTPNPETPDPPNVYPYFVGVFDTVASLSNPVALVLLVLAILLATGVVSWLAVPLLRLYDVSIDRWQLWLGLLLVIGAVSGLVHTARRIRVAFGLKEHPWWRTLHPTEGRMNFYDHTLNPNVAFARHALSLDEARSWFELVPWRVPKESRQNGQLSFDQVWFAGDHGDLGGGLNENYARLSDISLQWMLDAAAGAGLKIDHTLLRLAPDPAGPQNDEIKRSFVYRLTRRKPRAPKHDDPLHASVIARFEAEQVLHYDLMQPYRPDNLRHHEQVKHFYE